MLVQAESHSQHRCCLANLLARAAVQAGMRGRVTTQITTQNSWTRPGGHSQVIENMVELVGIEPTTSSLRTMRSPSYPPFLFNRLPLVQGKNSLNNWYVFGT